MWRSGADALGHMHLGLVMSPCPGDRLQLNGMTHIRVGTASRVSASF